MSMSPSFVASDHQLVTACWSEGPKNEIWSELVQTHVFPILQGLLVCNSNRTDGLTSPKIGSISRNLKYVFGPTDLINIWTSGPMD